MLARKTLGLAASFCLFAAFILSLFVMIGQLSNKAFLNLLYFVRANNKQYNLAYGFGLWSYCEGAYDAHVDHCSKATAAFDWYRTPGFSDMLPDHASSGRIRGVFIGMFTLYFVGLGFSFILWVMSLPLNVLCCFRRLRHNPGGRPMDVVMATWSGLTCLIMFVAMVIAIVYVISFNRNIANASVYWSGHAGYSLWFTIGIVVALLIATILYALKSCITGYVEDDSGFSPSRKARNKKLGKRRVNPDEPFDLPYHQPHLFHTAGGNDIHTSQPATPLMVNQTYQQQSTIPQTSV